MKRRKRHFRYKEYGHGTPLVMIPGLDGLTEFFTDIVPQLVRDYRVIVYHLPLFAEAVDAGEGYSFEFIADDLRNLLDELGIEKTHVVGESFGGVVAQVLTLNHGELVDKLVIISSAPHFELSLKNKLLLPLFRFVPMWLFARLHVNDVFEPHDPQWAKELFLRGASWADHASVLARARIVSRVDLRNSVPKITVPTLIVIGGADHFTGRASRAMNQLLPDSRIVEIPGGGHLCHLTHPDRFVDAVSDFLEPG